MDNSIVEETKVVQATPTGQVEKHTVATNTSIADFTVSKASQMIMSFVTIINILIGLRFIFLLLDANRVGIVKFILNITDVLVAPFTGIFSSPSDGSSYFDTASILAIIMWTVLAIILVMLVKMFSTRTD